MAKSKQRGSDQGAMTTAKANTKKKSATQSQASGMKKTKSSPGRSGGGGFGGTLKSQALFGLDDDGDDSFGRDSNDEFSEKKGVRRKRGRVDDEEEDDEVQVAASPPQSKVKTPIAPSSSSMNGIKKRKTLEQDVAVIGTKDPRFAAATSKAWLDMAEKAKNAIGADDDGDEDADEHAGEREEEGEGDDTMEMEGDHIHYDDDDDDRGDGDDNDELHENEEKDDTNDESHLPPGEQRDILGINGNNTGTGGGSSNNEGKGASKPITMAALASFNSKIDQSGVVYLSRIPPFMKPQKLRQLLAATGAVIGRIYLAPEDSKIAARRKKYRGNKRQNFTEGWVEFADKKVARRTAELLNAQPIGGKKRNRYHDDLWMMKYLPRFKWGQLTEQIAYEKAVRDQKLRAEMEAVKRENKAYLKNVEKAKMLEGMEEKRKKKLATAAAQGKDVAAMTTASEPQEKKLRTYRQRPVKGGGEGSAGPAPATTSVKRAAVLSKIFGRGGGGGGDRK